MTARGPSRQPAAVGMMEGAFFVSRTELLGWANDFFQLNLTKVEQCANGAVYCQIIDACHPGALAMHKLNWLARSDHEFIPNYKILQAGFDKIGITKHIPVNTLIRGKYQDNLEMMQWMKHYFDNTYAEGKPYDPIACRRGMKLPDFAKAGDIATKENRAPPARSKTMPEESLGGSARGSFAKAKLAPRMTAGYPAPPAAPAARPAPAANAELESLRDEAADLKTTVDGLEGERDYYFRKLRDIEILCQTLEASSNPDVTVPKLISEVQAILYARDDGDAEPEESTPQS